MKSELYFRHDVYTLDDPDMMKFVFKFKDAGYGLFWAVIERLTADPSHVIKKEDLVMQVAIKLCSSDSEAISQVIDYAIECNLLSLSEDGVFNDRVIRQCENIERCSQIKRENAQSRWNKSKRNANAEQTQSESSADNNNNENKTSKRVQAQDIVNLYNRVCGSLPKVLKLTDARIAHVQSLMRHATIDQIQEVFKRAEESSFLRSGNGTWNGASFDWLINQSNFAKVLEGNYTDKKRTYIPETIERGSDGGFDL